MHTQARDWSDRDPELPYAGCVLMMVQSLRFDAFPRAVVPRILVGRV